MKITRMADGLLKGLQESAQMEKEELKVRENFRTLSKSKAKMIRKLNS